MVEGDLGAGEVEGGGEIVRAELVGGLELGEGGLGVALGEEDGAEGGVGGLGLGGEGDGAGELLAGGGEVVAVGGFDAGAHGCGDFGEGGWGSGGLLGPRERGEHGYQAERTD